MPIVPFTSPSPRPGRPPPDEPWALMAAAQMHAEGRLIKVMDTTDMRRSDDIEDRRHLSDEQSREGPEPSAYTAKEMAAARKRNTPLGQALGGKDLDR